MGSYTLESINFPINNFATLGLRSIALPSELKQYSAHNMLYQHCFYTR